MSLERVGHHRGMVINMNEAQVRTVEQMREVLSGTQALQFEPLGEDAARYGWIGAVLKRLVYRPLKRGERGVVLAYLQHLSGYSRAQVTRLVSRWMKRRPPDQAVPRARPCLCPPLHGRRCAAAGAG